MTLIYRSEIGRKVLILTFICAFDILAANGIESISKLDSRTDLKRSSEKGDMYYFFLPIQKHETISYSYLFDTELNRILSLSIKEEGNRRYNSENADPKEWVMLLIKILCSKKQNLEQIQVLEISDEWIKFSFSGRHIVLPKEFMVGVDTFQLQQGNIPLGQAIVNKDTPLPKNYVPDDLVEIDQKWNFHTDEYPKSLRIQVVFMLEQMLRKAEDDGINIRVFSAYRSYQYQRYLYLNEVSMFGMDQNRVSKPGHSEHQLGTAVDLCGLDPSSLLNPNFGLSQEGKWLNSNSQNYHFYQSYIEENKEETGYLPEPWHYRYKPG